MKLQLAPTSSADGGTAAVYAMRFVARPILGPSEGIDFTDAVIGGIAHRLHELYGGNEVLNRVEAERLLREALASML